MAYKGEIIELKFDGGVVDLRSVGRNESNRLAHAQSVSMEILPTIRHAGEPDQYNSSAISGSPTILAGCDWWPSAGVHRTVIVGNDGVIRKDTYDAGTFATTLHNYGGSLNSLHVPNFVEAGKEVAANNRKLFIFVRDQIVRVLSGDAATATAITTPPADWTGSNQPICGAVHEGRLWGAGNPNDPHRVYYSTTGNHEDFTGAGSGSLSIFPGEGEKIVAMRSFKGLLVVWKYPRGIYYVDTTDPTVANWKIKVLTRSIGGVSSTGHAIVDDDVIFIDAQADIHLLSSVQEFGDMTSRSLTKLTKTQNYVRGNVFAGIVNLGAAQCVYHAARREVHFALPSTSTAVNLFQVVIDFNAEIPRFSLGCNLPVSSSIWNIVDSDGVPRYMIGNNAGILFKADVYNTALSPDGTFASVFYLAPTDFYHIDPTYATKRKSARFIEIIAANYLDVDNVITFSTYWDADPAASPATHTKVLTIPANTPPRPYKFRTVGGGRYFQLTVSSTTGLNILAMYLYMGINDERKI